MITDEQLKRWHELADAATSGPWLVDETGVYHPMDGWDSTISMVDELSDRSFIASARDAVPNLCAEVERLRAATRDREAVILLMIEFLRKSAHECMEAHEKRDAEFMKWLKNKRGQQPAPMVALPIAASMMRDAADALSAAIAQRAAEGNE